MTSLPNCPKCNSEYTYEDGDVFICPECANEWTLDSTSNENVDAIIVKDSNGNILNDGDSVTIIKDLKVKGSSTPLKQGTKVKGIRLVEGDHNIDCKINGFGAMKLKSEFVKKI
ncbi:MULTISPECIES: zinc ribbon domain-containing protein YjdM [Clostridium]|jgi:protein PhnA|uniref:Alkylphosphonate uptake protein n=2 Tax=Clostridium intestinale TaxID=36845 RepID=U2Q501_9CLOT|nr:MULTISPECIES: zinc ribbon domain-containing protein YjdM [Clostridium]ERK31194.1 alkylphosphonate uptake protein [Clostridium intestinale URNW]QLY82181.1 alkylphosphonate utilization protein [Clostridium intestinale]